MDTASVSLCDSNWNFIYQWAYKILENIICCIWIPLAQVYQTDLIQLYQFVNSWLRTNPKETPWTPNDRTPVTYFLVRELAILDTSYLLTIPMFLLTHAFCFVGTEYKAKHTHTHKIKNYSIFYFFILIKKKRYNTGHIIRTKEQNDDKIEYIEVKEKDKERVGFVRKSFDGNHANCYLLFRRQWKAKL